MTMEQINNLLTKCGSSLIRADMVLELLKKAEPVSAAADQDGAQGDRDDLYKDNVVLSGKVIELETQLGRADESNKALVEALNQRDVELKNKEDTIRQMQLEVKNCRASEEMEALLKCKQEQLAGMGKRLLEIGNEHDQHEAILIKEHDEQLKEYNEHINELTG